MLWYYAKGKPKETVEHGGQLSVLTEADLARMSDAELAAKALELAARAQTIAAAFGRPG